jgi:integrase
MTRRAKGEGSIVKGRADGRVEVKVDLGRDTTGKRIRRSVYGKTPQEAAKAAADLRQQFYAGTLTRPGTKTTTVAQLHRTYVDHLDARVTAGKITTSTRDNYEWAFRVHVVSHISDVRVIDVTAADIEYLVSRPQHSGSTRRKIYLACRQAFGLAVRDKIAPTNVVLALTESKSVPQQDSDSPDPATPHQVELLLKVADPVMTTAIIILALTGLRRVELLALQWSDVDIPGRRLTIRRSKTRAGLRVQAIGDELADYLAKIIGDHHHPDEYIVPNQADPFRPKDPRAFARSFELVSAKAGLHLTPHQLKHMVGTQLGHSGVAPQVLARVLGHSSTRELDRYVHSTPTAEVSAMNLLTLNPPSTEGPNA